MGNTVELEQFLQPCEVLIGEADGLFAGQPFGHVCLIGVAALGSSLSSYEHELHVVALGYHGTQFLARLNGSTAGTTGHASEIDDEQPAGVLGCKVPNEFLFPFCHPLYVAAAFFCIVCVLISNKCINDVAKLQRFPEIIYIFPLYLLGQIAVAATMEVGNALADELEGAGVIKQVHRIDI